MRKKRFRKNGILLFLFGICLMVCSCGKKTLKDPEITPPDYSEISREFDPALTEETVSVESSESDMPEIVPPEREFIVPEYSQSYVDASPEQIPEFSGEDVVVLNDNTPLFTKYELATLTGEHYPDLDELGRCGTVWAMLERSMMPTEERGQIGSVQPSGWNQAKYPGIVNSDPPYLYNRCHLIAYALTGQNANEKNLITGTRYFNASSMLNYEMTVMSYLERTGNHVLYRVSPYFMGDDLVARGVEMEAYSVEDEGEGICFHVFVYNHQPGVIIDYATGESHEDTGQI